jgi:hypothetical protein
MIATTLSGLLAMITPPASQRIDALSQGSVLMNEVRAFWETFSCPAPSSALLPTRKATRDK